MTSHAVKLLNRGRCHHHNERLADPPPRCMHIAECVQHIDVNCLLHSTWAIPDNSGKLYKELFMACIKSRTKFSYKRLIRCFICIIYNYRWKKFERWWVEWKGASEMRRCLLQPVSDRAAIFTAHTRVERIFKGDTLIVLLSDNNLACYHNINQKV